MDNNLKLWNDVKQPPDWALKEITGGRLKGKTDINPQWRYEALTQHFGLCGIGWKYEIVRLWTEKASGDEIFAFSEIKLYIKQNENWSEAIPGIGGSMLIESEKNGLHSNDEAFKMATTDALSVAAKMLGIGAAIYSGSKYTNAKDKEPVNPKPAEPKPSKDDMLKKYHDFYNSLPEELQLLSSELLPEKDRFVLFQNCHWNVAEVDAELVRRSNENNKQP